MRRHGSAAGSRSTNWSFIHLHELSYHFHSHFIIFNSDFQHCINITVGFKSQLTLFVKFSSRPSFGRFFFHFQIFGKVAFRSWIIDPFCFFFFSFVLVGFDFPFFHLLSLLFFLAGNSRFEIEVYKIQARLRFRKRWSSISWSPIIGSTFRLLAMILSSIFFLVVDLVDSFPE